MSNIKNVSHQRLMLLRHLMSIAFHYGHNKSLFYKKFMEAMNIDSLKSHDVLELNGDLLTNKELEKLENALDIQNELEIYSLTKQGFTAQELSVIYGLKNINSVYVKRSRINKKIKGAVQPEVIVIGIGLLLIWLTAMYFLRMV